MGRSSAYRLTLLFLVLLCSQAFGQETRFRYYDSLTYVLYQEADYKAVIKHGVAALQEGNDSYYIRMRVAISYFNLKRYGASVVHFRKALIKNKNKVVLEYLYFAYLYSGRREDARHLVCQNNDLMDYLNIDCSKTLSSIYIEGGRKFSDGAAKEIGDISFFHMGFTHDFSPRFSFYQGYSHAVQRFYSFNWENRLRSPGRGPGGQFQDDSVEVRSGYSFYQNEYYGSLSINAGGGFLIIPAYHFQAVTGLPANQSLSLQLKKRIRSVSMRAGYTRSRINQFNQNQLLTGITWYPKGNQNSYLMFEYTIHHQEEYTGFYYSKIGFRLIPKVWLEGYYGWGKMFNFTDLNGFYIYNIPDTIQYRSGGALIFLINRQHTLNVGFINESKRSWFTGSDYRHTGFYVTFTSQL